MDRVGSGAGAEGWVKEHVREISNHSQGGIKSCEAQGCLQKVGVRVEGREEGVDNA